LAPRPSAFRCTCPKEKGKDVRCFLDFSRGLITPLTSWCTCHEGNRHDHAKLELPAIRGADKEINQEKKKETGMERVEPPDGFRLCSIARIKKGRK
jgi:hypothetical protein